MKLIFIFLLSICLVTTHAQSGNLDIYIDSALAKKISVAGFCLCQTSLSQLQKSNTDLKEVEVEEMDLPKKCYGQDSRFENGKGYQSGKHMGVIFQKDQNNDQISKIRLTKDFKGNLPDGIPVNMSTLTLQDVFTIYPYLKEKWGSRGCSQYWSFSNDTLAFYVKIDTTKKPQFPIDEAYYYNKPIEGIDLVVSCYSISQKNEELDNFFATAVVFIDNRQITKDELRRYDPNETASLVVSKNTSDHDGKLKAYYFETKKFARNKYWNYFKTKSQEYVAAVPNQYSDSLVVYILNGKPLLKNFEADLAAISDKNLIDLKVIDEEVLQKDFGIIGKKYGILLKTSKSKATTK